MKRFLSLILVLALSVGLFAANTDRYNIGTVTVTETFSSINYEWNLTFLAAYDSTDRLHSPAMLIADGNAVVRER